MKTIRVMYVATNETYYALRSMDSEHLRAAFRAGVRVEYIQVAGDALAVQLQLTMATPSRIYVQHAGENKYIPSFQVGEKVPSDIQHAFTKQIHAETQDDLISSVHDIVRSLPGVHIKTSSLRSARSTKLSNLETFDIFVEG